MQLLITKNYKKLSKAACRILIRELKKNPNSNIAFATGKTPKGLYQELIKANKKHLINFSKIHAFNLDEYYPIKKSDKKSYFHYLHSNLFNHININPKNIHLLNGESKAPKEECKNYENLLKRNPITLAILGVGINSHIAFNEPGSLINSKTRLVKIKHKAVKNKALTLGIKNILAAKKILLLASGKEKTQSISNLIKSKPNKKFPVTFLKKHKNLIVILDKEAAKLSS